MFVCLFFAFVWVSVTCVTWHVYSMQGQTTQSVLSAVVSCNVQRENYTDAQTCEVEICFMRKFHASRVTFLLMLRLHSRGSLSWWQTVVELSELTNWEAKSRCGCAWMHVCMADLTFDLCVRLGCSSRPRWVRVEPSSATRWCTRGWPIPCSNVWWTTKSPGMPLKEKCLHTTWTQPYTSHRAHYVQCVLMSHWETEIQTCKPM